MKKLSRALPFLVLSLLLAWAPAMAEDAPDQTVNKSLKVLKAILTAHDRSLPQDLLKDSTGVAIVPALWKGGFIVGGSIGNGVVLRHHGQSWSPPAFFKFGMASVGLQIGVQKIELVMVVMGDKTMDAFLKNKFKLGGDVAVAAGPVGARSSAAAEITLKGGIYSYSRTKGLFAGLSLEGGGIDATPELNERYYGNTSSTKDILDGKVTVPDSGRQLINYLNQFHSTK